MSLDRNQFKTAADWLGVMLAASLPWSTSATGILAVLWLVAAVPAIESSSLRRILLSPAGAAPVILVGLGAVGMLWAEVSWTERFEGLSSFLKLLFIPLLLCHFGQSSRGRFVLIGFLWSCVLLLLVSWGSFYWQEVPSQGKIPGIPIKDSISQAAMFSVAIFSLGFLTCSYWRDGRRYLSFALVGLILLFLANIFFIATSRTSLVVIPVMLMVLGFRIFGWKGAAALAVGFLILAAAAWPSANNLRDRVAALIHDIATHQPQGTATSAGERLEFWKKSINSIKTSPVIGHGIGSIPDQFRRAAAGQTGMAGEASVNPHNQTFVVGIQLGLLGIAILSSMWIAHLLLFRSDNLAAWIGLMIVIQNIIGSLFNSHLSDFTHGWLYVVGVGVAGGITTGLGRISETTPS